jgi:serine/threonine-protein kinase
VEELLGQTIGPYQIEAILGSGGMAVVYRARHTQDDVVALKVLFPPPGAGAEIIARFEREARTSMRLRHPAIVRVVEAGQADGRAFMAMALIEGESLADRLARVGPLDETMAADIAWQIADALDYAHHQGVVHRDIKPSNILLATDGRALLTDFGVALALDDPALTRTGHTVGTPAYMAPEQANGAAVDGRADLYSLGVVLYQMVTGRTPFRGNTPQVLHAHVYDPPPAPSTRFSVLSSRFVFGFGSPAAVRSSEFEVQGSGRTPNPNPELNTNGAPRTAKCEPGLVSSWPPLPWPPARACGSSRR